MSFFTEEGKKFLRIISRISHGYLNKNKKEYLNNGKENSPPNPFFDHQTYRDMTGSGTIAFLLDYQSTNIVHKHNNTYEHFLGDLKNNQTYKDVLIFLIHWFKQQSLPAEGAVYWARLFMATLIG